MQKLVFTETAVHRLTVLADFLDALPTGVFNLSNWINEEVGMDFVSDEGTGQIAANLSTEEMHACGATACAFGWACTIPEFQKLGLTLSIYTGFPKFEGKESFPAATKFFDLPVYDMNDTFCPIVVHLFDMDEYENGSNDLYGRDDEDPSDPKTVARRIRLMLANPPLMTDYIDQN